MGGADEALGAPSLAPPGWAATAVLEATLEAAALLEAALEAAAFLEAAASLRAERLGACSSSSLKVAFIVALRSRSAISFLLPPVVMRLREQASWRSATERAIHCSWVRCMQRSCLYSPA